MSLPNTNAVVVAVSASPEHGFSKQTRPFIRLIAGEGVEGDAHRGTTTQHLYLQRKDPTLPNLCHLHLLSQELLAEYSATSTHTIRPGELGENLLTCDVDLLALPLGTRLHIGTEAIVEVTGLRTPCSQIDAFRPGLQQHLWGPRSAPGGKRTRRAGIMAIVLTNGTITPGDKIRIDLPPPPHRPLPAV